MSAAFVEVETGDKRYIEESMISSTSSTAAQAAQAAKQHKQVSLGGVAAWREERGRGRGQLATLSVSDRGGKEGGEKVFLAST